ncbi:nuclease-related domain-containing protein [Niallia sp. Krafla_26]|uniref:nuclease-related domain-containing protein n=1 Tax=Niallia sp. Krafla_26 TaxID=3064703 RepID=UPI003D16DC81
MGMHDETVGEHYKTHLEQVKWNNQYFFGKSMVKVLIAAVVIYIFRVIQKGSNSYVYEGTAVQEMGRIAIRTLPTFFIVLLLGAGVLWYIGKRKYDAELVKVRQVDYIAGQVIKKHAPFPTVEKIKTNMEFIDTAPEHLEPEKVKMANDQQEIFLSEKIKHLEDLRLTEEEAAVSQVERIHFSLLSEYQPYVLEQFNKQLYQKNVNDIDWIYKGINLVQRFEEYVQEAHESYSKELGIIASGNRGEERVENELDLMKSYCTYLSNVRLEVEGNSVETDSIVFSPNGIFFLEVKNFAEKGNYSLKIAKDGQWQQIYQNGTIIPMKDVQAQNNRHIFLKDRFIREQWEKLYGEAPPSIHYHSVIVIANDHVMINNESDVPVIRISQLYHHIMKFQDSLSQDVLDRVKNIILSNQLPPKEYAVHDYSKGIEEYRAKINILEEHGQAMWQLYYDYLGEVQGHRK